MIISFYLVPDLISPIKLTLKRKLDDISNNNDDNDNNDNNNNNNNNEESLHNFKKFKESTD